MDQKTEHYGISVSAQKGVLPLVFRYVVIIKIPYKSVVKIVAELFEFFGRVGSVKHSFFRSPYFYQSGRVGADLFGFEQKSKVVVQGNE
tara:strand:- start:278 stop:544 length:267 start_codon:yes stop_codon:yes gene_type:complete